MSKLGIKIGPDTQNLNKLIQAKTPENNNTENFMLKRAKFESKNSLEEKKNKSLSDEK